jgi:Protein of unknown function (DUF1045)
VTGPNSRVALYYAPVPDDPLWSRGNAWMGRDPATGATLAEPEVAGLHAITRDAARYGFHGTLTPPMRLRDGVSFADFAVATRAVASGIPRFSLPPLAVTDLFGFLALTETEPSPSLQAYADACIAGVDHLRVPIMNEELARRRGARLAPAEDANLVRWGYPYVFATWFFHLTLTRKLSDVEQTVFRPAAEAWFDDVTEEPRQVRDICVFVQRAPDEMFRLVERVPLAG